jgi:hypothetical protein
MSIGHGPASGSEMGHFVCVCPGLGQAEEQRQESNSGNPGQARKAALYPAPTTTNPASQPLMATAPS